MPCKGSKGTWIPSCIYIILNLAVGGSWVGNPNDETSFENNPYVIDYVRVYQKDSYDEDVKRPSKGSYTYIVR